MFCEKCGKQLPEGSAFCDGCGAKMTADTENAQPAAETAGVAEKQPFVLTKQHKIIGLAGIGVIVLAIIIAIIVSIAGKNVKLDKYFTVASKGYNGYGSVDYEVDYEALFERITGEDVSDYEDVEDIESLGNAATLMADAAAISGAVSVDVKYPDGKAYDTLSNGDVVTYTLSFDEAVAKKYDIKVKTVTVEHKVENLGEAAVFDVLSHYSVEFSGYNGVGEVKLVPTETNETIGDVNFVITADDEDKVSYKDNKNGYSGSFYVYVETDTYALSNGDTVTVTVSGASSDSLSEHGIVLDGLTKDFTVEGLAEAQTFDVLANISVTFSGVDGDGQAVVTATESTTTVGDLTFTTSPDDPRYISWVNDKDSYYDGSLYVSLDEAYDLSIGDTVTLQCDYDADYFAEYGVILEGLTKEFTVESLGTYAAALEDISEDSLTALSEKYQEDLMNRLYDDWADTVHNSWRTYKDQKISEDMALYKTIMTTPKNTSSSTYNDLWLIFSVTLSDDSMDEATKYYFYYDIEDVVVNADGEVDLEMDYYISKSEGYTDYNEIYDDKIDSFNVNIEIAE